MTAISASVAWQWVVNDAFRNPSNAAPPESPISLARAMLTSQNSGIAIFLCRGKAPPAKIAERSLSAWLESRVPLAEFRMAVIITAFFAGEPSASGRRRPEHGDPQSDG